jgi:hypothetical protein
MKRFLEIFEDNSGGLSSTRVLLLAWGLGVLAIWIAMFITTHALAPIPDSIITILGILFGGKVVQRFGEKGEVTIDPPTTPTKNLTEINKTP